MTQEFGIYGARNAAFCESALEVAGWGRAGTMRDLNFFWPFLRLPPTKRAFFAFFFLRFFLRARARWGYTAIQRPDKL